MGHKPDQRARKRRRDREARGKRAADPAADERAMGVRLLALRRKENEGIVRIDNASLHAGSPMYYYCRMCDAEIEVPEEHDPPAPTHCEACAKLREQGWNDAKKDFSNEVKDCTDCEGKGRRTYRGFGERTCQTCGGRGKIVIESS